MRVLLARHGESTWNAEGRYQGRRDPSLTDLGRAQAAALAGRVKSDPHWRAGSIVTSPLSRARDTAAAVAQSLELPVNVDEHLIEISHGEWEGLLKSEIADRWPELYAAWNSAPETVTFPGGESLRDVLRRWRAFLADAERFASPIFVVTHDVIIRLAILDALGAPMRAFQSLASENAALSELDITADKRRVATINERSYLGHLRVDPAEQAL